MFFVLSKMATFFLQPFNWLVFLLIIWLVVKNKKIKKRILITLLVLFFLFSNDYLHSEIEFWYQINQSTIDTSKQYEAGIVLGGFASYDKNKVGRFNPVCDRFIETNKLYHQGIIKKIIIASGSASVFLKEPGEADFVAEQFILAGAKKEDIYIDNKSRNTFENAQFSKKIVDSLHLKGPFVLVTSAFHLPRALLVFEKAGFPVLPYPADVRAYDRIYSFTEYFWPSMDVLADWNYLIKEFVGIAAYKLTGKL